MSALKGFATAVLAAAVLGGCTTGSIGVKSDVGSQAFEVGKTTRADVVKAAGLPQRIEKDDAGNERYFYERSAHLTGMCLGCGMVGNTSGLIPAAAVQSSKDKARKNAIEFVFNAEGTLISAQ